MFGISKIMNERKGDKMGDLKDENSKLKVHGFTKELQKLECSMK